MIQIFSAGGTDGTDWPTEDSTRGPRGPKKKMYFLEISVGRKARRRQWHLTCDTPLPPLIFWQPQNYPTMFSPTIFLQPDILMLEFLCFIPEIKICYLSLCSSSWIHDYLFNKIASLLLQLELMWVQLSKCPLFRLHTFLRLFRSKRDLQVPINTSYTVINVVKHW